MTTSYALSAADLLDPEGLTLTVTRDASAATTLLNSVFLVPPVGVPLSLDVRLLMRLTFDLPRAEALPPSIPEPWAVALNVAAETVIPTSQNPPPPDMVSLTCQFNRKFNGVRLNTPGSLQTDQSPNLESPLNYDDYQGGYVVLPDGTDGDVPPPVFTLEHSFCGWNFDATHPVVGAGTLKISRTWRADVEDHRVYSSDRLLSVPSQPVTRIGALGITLAMQGIGQVKVRLRTFSLLFNAQPSTVTGQHSVVVDDKL